MKTDGGYDRLAPWYHAIEWLTFGRRLHRQRLALLPKMRPPKSMLLLGDGDGRFLQAAAGQFRDCRFTSVDRTAAMLDRQRRRLSAAGHADRVTWVHADARSYQPARSQFDAAAMVCFLDCFTAAELHRCLPRWVIGVRPDGQLLTVDFTVTGPRRLTAASLRWASHRFFRWTTDLPNRRLVLDDVLPPTADATMIHRDPAIGLAAMLWPAAVWHQKFPTLPALPHSCSKFCPPHRFKTF